MRDAPDPDPMRDPAAVRVRVDVDARPSTVWRCVTEAGMLAEWLEAAVEFRATPGAPVRIRFARHPVVVEGRVVEVVEGRRIAFTWGVAEGAQGASMPAGSTRVTIALEPAGDGTRVTLTHAGLPAHERADHEVGWREYLEAMAKAAARAGG